MCWLLEVCVLLFTFNAIDSGTYSVFSFNFNVLIPLLGYLRSKCKLECVKIITIYPRLSAHFVWTKNSVDFRAFLKFRQIFVFLRFQLMQICTSTADIDIDLNSIIVISVIIK